MSHLPKCFIFSYSKKCLICLIFPKLSHFIKNVSFSYVDMSHLPKMSHFLEMYFSPPCQTFRTNFQYLEQCANCHFTALQLFAVIFHLLCELHKKSSLLIYKLQSSAKKEMSEKVFSYILKVVILNGSSPIVSVFTLVWYVMKFSSSHLALSSSGMFDHNN